MPLAMTTFGNPVHYSRVGMSQEMKLWNNHILELTSARALSLLPILAIWRLSTPTRGSTLCLGNPEVCSQ